MATNDPVSFWLKELIHLYGQINQDAWTRAIEGKLPNYTDVFIKSGKVPTTMQQAVALYALASL